VTNVQQTMLNFYRCTLRPPFSPNINLSGLHALGHNRAACVLRVVYQWCSVFMMSTNLSMTRVTIRFA